MAEHNEIGKIGENITKTFLMKHGFSVLESNYRTRFGEVDIIAKKDNALRFIEVKSVKVRGGDSPQKLGVRPEDNLTSKKWNHLKISAETYLRHKNVPHVTRWQIDLACVYIDMENKEGRVVLMENAYLDQG